MMIRSCLTRRFPAAALALTTVIVLGLALAPRTPGAERKKLSESELKAKVERSVVCVKTDGGSGSGFVVDAAAGLVFTNCHVIKHAKKVEVIFTADPDDPPKHYPTFGWVYVMPTKDVALIHADLSGRKTESLKIADRDPKIGDPAYPMGSPLGMPLTISDGKVKKIHTGKELTEKDPWYAKMSGYDAGARWIEHSGAISHGNSGGPLFNEYGEVLGLNTWVVGRPGDMHYFAIAWTHLKEVYEKEKSTETKSWDKLPDWPGAGSAESFEIGDKEKTIGAWRALNEAKVKLEAKLKPLQKKLTQIEKDQNIRTDRQRNKRLADQVYAKMIDMYKAYASDIQAIDTANANSMLVQLIMMESEVAKRYATEYDSLATELRGSSAPHASVEAGSKLHTLQVAMMRIGQLREQCALNYKRWFGDHSCPTVEETAREMERQANGETSAANPDQTASVGGGDQSSEPAAPRTARGPETRKKLTTAELIKAVGPGLVTVTADDAAWGGFVADAETGLIVTSCHALKNVKRVEVSFPGNKEGSSRKYPTEGWVAVFPKIDVALIRVDPSGTVLQALKMADWDPETAEVVYSITGMKPAQGKVSGMRTGRQLSVAGASDADWYTVATGYGAEARWIQHDAPLSQENSGGPVLNEYGDVMGLNTWTRGDGDKLIFAISSTHIKPLVAQMKDTKAQPWNTLPIWDGCADWDIRMQSGCKGKTIDAWRKLNDAKNELEKQLEPLRKKLSGIQADRSYKSDMLRNKKLAPVYRKIGEVYKGHVGNVKAIGTTFAHRGMIALLLQESDISQAFANKYEDLAKDMAGGGQNLSWDKIEKAHNLPRLKDAASNLATERNVAQTALKKLFGNKFPTLEESTEEAKTRGTAGPKEESSAGVTSRRPKPEARVPDQEDKRPTEAGMRTWKNNRGKEVRAKLIRREGDKVKLKRADGKEFTVSIKSLCEDDQDYIESTTSE